MRIARSMVRMVAIERPPASPGSARERARLAIESELSITRLAVFQSTAQLRPGRGRPQHPGRRIPEKDAQLIRDRRRGYPELLVIGDPYRHDFGSRLAQRQTVRTPLVELYRLGGSKLVDIRLEHLVSIPAGPGNRLHPALLQYPRIF